MALGLLLLWDAGCSVAPCCWINDGRVVIGTWNRSHRARWNAGGGNTRYIESLVHRVSIIP